MKMRKILWTFFMMISFCVFIISAYKLISQYLAYHTAEKEYVSLGEIANMQNEESTPEKNTDTSSYVSPIDFDALAKVNPDVVGWIFFDDTEINYPIVQSNDNESYLHTSFKKARNPAGAIFMDYRNTSDFTNSNTIIYGHNMKNGSMFADLIKYKKQSFYKNHPVFYIYTPDTKYRCEIFSAYAITSKSKIYATGFLDADGFTKYLNYVLGNSFIRTHIAPHSMDRIVTLSTCDYQFDNGRMLIHARITEHSDRQKNKATESAEKDK